MQMGGMPMGSGGFNPQIILLKEGTDTSQGKAQLISNINACAAVADIVRTTLGPRGMDKLMHKEGKVTVSNDGATIMKTLEIVHPAAQCLVDIAKSQDSEVSAAPSGTHSDGIWPGDCACSFSLLNADCRAEFQRSTYWYGVLR
jgi:hypothetical protein